MTLLNFYYSLPLNHFILHFYLFKQNCVRNYWFKYVHWFWYLANAITEDNNKSTDQSIKEWSESSALPTEQSTVQWLQITPSPTEQSTVQWLEVTIECSGWVRLRVDPKHSILRLFSPKNWRIGCFYRWAFIGFRHFAYYYVVVKSVKYKLKIKIQTCMV